MNNTRVDENKLADIIRKEYDKAGVKPSDLTVGAVIITGESSRKENSRELVHSLGTLAGDFVVASAGPDLEGILAGKGCGAAALSQKLYGLVANIDIGGGTSNIALFDNGFPVDTACLDIGGRQIRFVQGSDVIEYIAPRTKELCKKMNLSLREGERALPQEIEALCKRYTEILMEALGILQETPERSLMMTDHPLVGTYQIQYLTFSGGVADLYYNGGGETNPYLYNDIGVFFSRAIRKYLPKHVKVLTPEETIRATVIGAGAFTATLSGSTIDIAKGKLPLKNIPVISFSPQEEKGSKKERLEIIRKKIGWVWDGSGLAPALAFGWQDVVQYQDLQDWADCLASIAEDIGNNGGLMVVIIQKDLAKAFGQILGTKTQYPYLSLDSITVQDGDYIDIGQPLAEGRVVPVIVKSLIFNN